MKENYMNPNNWENLRLSKEMNFVRFDTKKIFFYAVTLVMLYGTLW